MTYLYRYYDTATNWEGGKTTVNINLDQYRIIKETPKGYWITLSDIPWGNREVPHYAKKFVLKVPEKTNRPPKRWAYFDIEDAYKSFVIRKEKQKMHLENALKRNQQVLYMIKVGVKEKLYFDTPLFNLPKLNL